MFSLGFYPELDAHHATFRALCISREFASIPVPTYRIIDYFLLNPFDLHSFRLQGTAHRKISAKFDYLRPYKRAAEPAAIAIHMWQFQQAALGTLARANFVSPSGLAADVVKFTAGRILSQKLNAEIKNELTAKAEVLSLLKKAINQYQLTGPGGLKDRSGLLDYRYDPKANVISA